ncbi:mannose-1-phosphate guanylyltransferase/mannose-6-phosphate isomerase [Sulfurovum sp. NBC37-1]|uniref:mannose-1-phosphate guanylyltransferase/mannose-6-phosphate isomerase n=1 Tax=Sulfurovum sp. (strain NBC37-1) TaxID=387093 RepID=UPI00015876BF|nr:mannose-1-phosphate guanylyltransferase/mannose-6-phosphate isomerase [Sulfurovum sp. NBC37-1]BAF71284.1 mannose-1-phosphate guanylyltransferase [Sulfurovum sp. NBC37-1]
MTNIILCGGNGTRLWPISRTLMPKQFVKLFNDESLFQLTVKRNSTACNQQFIVSNAEQYFLAVDQLDELEVTQSKFLLEPVGRNTAPAIALACFALDPDEIILVSPSDHLIKDEENYIQVLHRAKELAEQDNLVTFGIKPEYAETGYGYIESVGEEVKAFHEKPDIQTAKKYINAGNFYWNSGMFCFKAGLFLEELQKYSPEIYQSSEIAYKHAKINDMIRIAYDDMQNIPEDSIDYAVMEKSQKVKMVASDIGWSDLGSFDALAEEMPKDQNGNTQSEHLYSIDARNNFVYTKERAIALVDIEDLIVVDTADALLISKKGVSQKVKEVVKLLRKGESELHHIHLTAHRPWGTYTILETNEKYKIKRIVVHPGKRLSLQKHFHRSEHWIVVSGTALITMGEKEYLLKPNESTYIPMGEMHRLENPGKIDVILIEVQVGSYLGEDDIVRIQDDFQRS